MRAWSRACCGTLRGCGRIEVSIGWVGRLKAGEVGEGSDENGETTRERTLAGDKVPEERVLRMHGRAGSGLGEASEGGAAPERGIPDDDEGGGRRTKQMEPTATHMLGWDRST